MNTPTLRTLRHTLLMLCTVLLLGGCESTSPDTATAPPSAFPAPVGQMAFGTASEALPSAMDMHEAVSAIKSALHVADSWEDAHERVSEAIASVSPVQRSVAEQFAAAAMLNSPLTEGEATSRSAEVTAHYLDLLAQHGNPEAELYERGIEFAGSRLSDAHVVRLVDTAVEHALVKYADEQPCEDCGERDLPAHVQEIVESAEKEVSHANAVRAAAERLSRRTEVSS
jgi:hypothetical protein